MLQLSSRFLTLVGVLLVVLAIPVNGNDSVLPGSDQQIEQRWLDAWQQSSSEQASYVNRLVLSDSAYLRQHANNPIDWYPWDDDAFARAKKENRLILISIGYASCHWCHVMEKESFSDAEVARVLNQTLVSIKVDREQQPDIDAFFTMAVETINGDSGWPITMILLPDRTPVFAANYLSKEELITVVTRLNKFWQNQPDVMTQNAALLAAEIEKRSKRQVKSSIVPDTPWIEGATQRLLASIDPVNGGFGQDTKFPSELKLQFLLNQYKNSRDPELRDILIKQLNAQMKSGLNDVVYGGVFRYTTDRQMARPHFEKMLYNQALTVSLYVDASIWLATPAYKRYADSIISFARQTMQLQDGSYAAAINADHEGQEGGYYLWPAEVTEDLPGGLSKVPFEGGVYYLYGSTDVNQSSWRIDLQKYRSGPPEVIDNQISSWNALWIAALLKAGETSEAESLAETIWERSWSQNQLFRMGDQTGFLDDYSYLSSALWQLYLKTGDLKWKGRARILDNRILDLFVQDGSVSYHNKSLSGQYEIELHQDRELPSSLAVTLDLFNKHQAELSFIEAFEDIKTGAAAAIGNRPEYYLTLIQAMDGSNAAAEQIIAQGHGMVSLRSMDEPGQWQLVFNLDPGWHINASEVFDKRLIPTRVSSTENIRNIEYPQGDELSTDFSSDPMNVYSNHVVINVETASESAWLLVNVKLQACSNQVCLLPEEIQLAGHKNRIIQE